LEINMKMTEEMIMNMIAFHEKAEKAFLDYGQQQKAEEASKKKAELLKLLKRRAYDYEECVDAGEGRIAGDGRAGGDHAGAGEAGLCANLRGEEESAVHGVGAGDGGDPALHREALAARGHGYDGPVVCDLLQDAECV
jgi:hypothetical protein